MLAGQRIVEDDYFQKWEFPGGKFESGENAQQAVRRELAEELGIEVGETDELMHHRHDYHDRKVDLHILRVQDYQGEPRSAEGQAIRWCTRKDLLELDFLAGNRPIIDRVLALDEFASG